MTASIYTLQTASRIRSKTRLFSASVAMVMRTASGKEKEPRDRILMGGSP